MNTITINGKDYKVKYTLRALFIFEQIKNEPFKIETLLDNYLFFYSIILANNPDNLIEWNEFIDALDTDPKLYEQMNNIINKSNKVSELLTNEDIVEEVTGEKKN